MNPHYIIDGYNFLHAVPKFRQNLEFGLEFARTTLISFVRSYQSAKRVKITLVFDGDELDHINIPFQTNRWLKIIFSRPPEKADPLIKRLIQATKNKKSLISVSSDNDLVMFSKSLGVPAISPKEFYDLASSHPNEEQLGSKYNSHVSEQELEEWLKLFGEEPK